MFFYFGMKRFDDIKDVTVGDVRVMDGGDLKVYVRQSKNYQEGKGSVFHMSEERMSRCVELMCWFGN